MKSEVKIIGNGEYEDERGFEIDLTEDRLLNNNGITIKLEGEKRILTLGHLTIKITSEQQRKLFEALDFADLKESN